MFKIEEQESVSGKILKSAMIKEPFDHIILDSVFSEHYYREIIDNMPSDVLFDASRVSANRNINPNRSILELKDYHTDFWDDFFNRFLSRYFIGRILNKFGLSFGSKDSITGEIVRDKRGYSIGPHTDFDRKKLAILYYLPSDSFMQKYGTSICRPLSDMVIGNHSHWSWDQFEETHIALFKPNTLLAFRRTDQSFHALREIQEDVVRYSICCNVLDFIYK